jgi:hypothetical protein
MIACTGLPFDSRPPSVPDESLAVLIRGHEIAPGTQTDDSRHGAIINIGRTCWQVGSPCTRPLRFAYTSSGAVDHDLRDGRTRPAESRSACAGAREAALIQTSHYPDPRIELLVRIPTSPGEARHVTD